MIRLRIDETGSGNWQSLTLQSGDFPFLPSDVTLKSAKVSDGEIRFEAPNGEEISRLVDINGTLSADSMSGPYKFIGSTILSDTKHDIRFSTATPDADATVRFRSSIRSTASGISHLLDGTIHETNGRDTH